MDQQGDAVVITTGKVRIEINKKTSLFKVINLKDHSVVVEQASPVLFGKGKTSFSLKAKPDEYFYGGGVQNGRFSHRGKVISIENQNSWTDGGVASPTPFYWSTGGYGVMWHTFKKGQYDFGSREENLVNLSHDENYLDVFFMVNDGPVSLLRDFYQLTGAPVLLPKFAFYQGHLNAYNRDYWKEDEKGILFEDGKRYKESQKDNGGIKESLNGELNNYQFSGRAVVDRYKAHDMPLGWLLPNDGYGAGYGQTDTLDGNIANLKSLADYARKNGVEIGLWTQSDLHPKPEISALLQRDIVKEVRDAGVRVLKTDVAWVGAGYSFGLNGITDVAQIMTYYGNNSRPFIISLDGWAGTQRYSTVWSGDQVSNWDYIRYHIPTITGAGLSAMNAATSDVDGIFGGSPKTYTRDLQWKVFTPIFMTMSGWADADRQPWVYGHPYTDINRKFLKLKMRLNPYAYTYCHEAHTTGVPMARAMVLEFPDDVVTCDTTTQYQFMSGEWMMVAPVYTRKNVRDSIYFPAGEWYDYWTGKKYEGGKWLDKYEAKLDICPVFIRQGAIIPMYPDMNYVGEKPADVLTLDLYPYGNTSFNLYEDDGLTRDYKKGEFARTLISVSSPKGEKGTITVDIAKAKGDYKGRYQERTYLLDVRSESSPSNVTLAGKPLSAISPEAFNAGQEGWYFDASDRMGRVKVRTNRLSTNQDQKIVIGF